jgi:hypothetical protein
MHLSYGHGVSRSGYAVGNGPLRRMNRHLDKFELLRRTSNLSVALGVATVQLIPRYGLGNMGTACFQVHVFTDQDSV